MGEANSRERFEILRRVYHGLPHHAALGVRIVSLEPGRCTVRLPVDERFLTGVDDRLVHGGVIATLLDSACGAALLADMDEDRTAATLDMRVDYLRAAAPAQALIATGECYSKTRNVAFVRGAVFQDDSVDPVANGTATFMIGSVGFALAAGIAHEEENAD